MYFSSSKQTRTSSTSDEEDVFDMDDDSVGLPGLIPFNSGDLAASQTPVIIAPRPSTSSVVPELHSIGNE